MSRILVHLFRKRSVSYDKTWNKGPLIRSRVAQLKWNSRKINYFKVPLFLAAEPRIVIIDDKSLGEHRFSQGINETDVIRWPWRLSLISDVPLGRVHSGMFESTMCLVCVM